MSKYYCLIAGLPSLSPDDTKITYSVTDFKSALAPILTERDRRLMRWFYLKFDNRNLLSVLHKAPDDRFDDRGVFSLNDLNALVDSLKEDDQIPKNSSFPAYIPKFIRSYFVRLNNGETIDSWLLDDQLAALYYAEAMKCGNDFLSSWFEMNLNMGNLLSVLNCRKYGLDKEKFIVGDNEMAGLLRLSSARDLHFSDSAEYMTELLQIVEEREPMLREKRLDQLRWKWLDEQTFFKVFDIESVIAYMLRLEMIERWIKLDKALGGKTFRRLVSDMKRESANTLEEFKEKNK